MWPKESTFSIRKERNMKEENGLKQHSHETSIDKGYLGSMKLLQNVRRAIKRRFIKANDHKQVQHKDAEENYVIFNDRLFRRPPDPEAELLKAPCFYWPESDRVLSAQVLKNEKDGTFLVRKSSHPNHKYTLTYKREGSVASARVQYCEETALYSLDLTNSKLPRRESIRELIGELTGKSVMMWDYEKKERISSMSLQFPLYRVPSLKEQCKLVVMERTKNIDDLRDQLPHELVKYLRRE